MHALRNVLMKVTLQVLLLCLVTLPVGFVNAQERGDLDIPGAVDAPQIAVEPETISWTENLAWVKNGELRNFMITVTNNGDQVLDVYEIGTAEISGSGWLSVSTSTLAVPTGDPNTATFNVSVDAGALPYGLGNSSWLDGEVYLKSNADNIDSLTLNFHILAADSVQPVIWDTVATSTAWDPIKGGASLPGDNTALAVSNFGECGLDGVNGPSQVNLDFSLDGGECRTDERSQVYLRTSSPFIIQHDGHGQNLRLTTSRGLIDQRQEYSFDPLVSSNSITGGLSIGGKYDSVYTGPFANRDTSIILERTFYAPRNNPDNPSFMVCKTVVYSGDGQAHDNVTIGSFTDWDIPSVKSPDNTVGMSTPSSPAGQFVYARGTDADTSDANLICQVNANRYGAELFLDWHTNTEFNADPCTADTETWGSWGGSRLIASDTLINNILQPDVQKWYDSISVKEGVFANDSTFDQSIWVTYLLDHSIGAADTLTFYTLFATQHDAPDPGFSLEWFEYALVDAKRWYLNNIYHEVCDVCYATGDVDGNEFIDIGDLTELMGFLSGFHGPSGPLYVADVTGDCIVDALDLVALACFMPSSDCDPPSLPVATCCGPAVYHPGDTALATGEADIISAGDTMMVVNNVGASGNDGVRLYVDDISPLKLLAQSDSSRGISMELSNVDLSVDSASIFFEVNGDVLDIVPGKGMAGLEDLQLVGLAGVANNGTGALQIIGDFTPIGDPNVFVKVYQGGTQTGEATVTGGDAIALGNDAGNGLPQVLYVSIYTVPPPAVIIYLDRVTRFTLVDGPILFGDEIHLIALSATKTVLRGRIYDVTGGYLGWFGISKFDPDVCCRGFMGNADCDIVDMVDIGDVTEMIRVLFINVGTQFCCEEEADLDYAAPIDVGDLTLLIKHLFIDVTPPPTCP